VVVGLLFNPVPAVRNEAATPRMPPVARPPAGATFAVPRLVGTTMSPMAMSEVSDEETVYIPVLAPPSRTGMKPK
jgi:hypothetical protein